MSLIELGDASGQSLAMLGPNQIHAAESSPEMTLWESPQATQFWLSAALQSGDDVDMCLPYPSSTGKPGPSGITPLSDAFHPLYSIPEPGEHDRPTVFASEFNTLSRQDVSDGPHQQEMQEDRSSTVTVRNLTADQVRDLVMHVMQSSDPINVTVTQDGDGAT